MSTLHIRSIAVETIDRASAYLAIPVDEILGDRKFPELLQARWAIISTLHDKGANTSQMARLLQRDRTSINLGIRRARALKRMDRDFAKLLEALA